MTVLQNCVTVFFTLRLQLIGTQQTTHIKPESWNQLSDNSVVDKGRLALTYTDHFATVTTYLAESEGHKRRINDRPKT